MCTTPKLEKRSTMRRSKLQHRLVGLVFSLEETLSTVESGFYMLVK